MNINRLMFGQQAGAAKQAAAPQFGAAHQAQTAAPQSSMANFKEAMKNHNLNQPALPYTSGGRLNVIA